ncbi:inositol 1,4,5-trisphosphate-gated calcium channel ITPR2-like isoform X2 [Babylonia areolata]|uniref:inositol 1,4,5-trisphosphate-gated calcium channel ITPR2-like isoform X2 n=1 Tax=Babylonia areolata TaxID=304850 RepID=UPI003FD17F11
MMTSAGGAGDYLCIGDFICLYSVDTEGYIYSIESSTSHSGLYIYHGQDRDKPSKVPNPQAVTFQICIQNRYKLNKKYRKWMAQTSTTGEHVPEKGLMHQAKLAAEAENADNAAEQKRQLGKRVRYGEIVQLKHAFTNKYVHMCTSQTSQKDKNNMMIMLQEFNAKNAQFRILPQYKVKSEGEVVQIFDQIVFESIKSPGHFYHASQAFQVEHLTYGSELNLGVERSGFTLVRFCKENPELDLLVKGGSVIRLFHKELEAYMVAEGLFDDEVTEDVHFRIRVMDQHKPRTLSPPSSGNTFWQIEAENGILYGDIIRWEQQVRLRHMTTRKYLCIDEKHDIMLTDDNEDPKTVFRLHSVLSERDEIHFESYARIEHVLTGFWLHALKDEDYIRKQFRSIDDSQDQSMRGLRWDGAQVRQVAASGESMYDDAFTIQHVEKQYVDDFNYVAGMVPFLLNLIKDREEGLFLNAKKTHTTLTAMEELRKFLLHQGAPVKNRQKLMRNLRVIDLLVRILQCALGGVQDELNLIQVFKEAYEILYTYMIGKSRKNALYFAKYIDFFQTQFTQKGGIGINVAQMIVELIRDKRKIVDRITHQQIDEFVGLLQTSQNYRFLDLLHVLCVCDDVAIPNNQSYIVQRWLQCEQKLIQGMIRPQYPKGVYLTARGQDINRQPNILYISTTNGVSWQALHEFVDETYAEYDKDKHDFLLHQLDLYKALCFGRNDYSINIITKELRYLTWEETFLSLRSDILPDAIRAKYCDLTTSLFVDVGNNYSVLDHPNICFVYDYVGSKDEEKSQADFVVKELVAIFPVLRDWITEFLSENNNMVASEIGHNMLIEQVLRLLYHLVKFGYYQDWEDVQQLLPPMLSLLDGRKDFPFPKDKDKGYSKDLMKQVHQFQHQDRYEKSAETEAIVNAKFQSLEVLDLLLTYQRNLRLQSFMGKFKLAERNATTRKSSQHVLSPLLYDTYNPHDQSKRSLKKQKAVVKELRDMFNISAIFDVELLTRVLMDLSQYKYNKLITKSLNILNKVYSSKTNMFKLSAKAQVLLTQDSARVHREVLKNMPLLRRLARAKLDDQQVKLMSDILDDLAEFCHLPMTPDEPHPMNQNILISNGILIILFEILVQEIDPKLLEQYAGMTDIFKKTLYLLKLLARENETVQHHIFERLDILLEVRVVESDLAIALAEVFYGNQNTCLKINPRQIQKIVNRAAELQDRAPEFLDLLSMIVKVAGTGLTLKRNQAYVMKYIMQNYKKLAFVLDLPRDDREKILTNSSNMSTLRYYISLLDLLAVCAEGENMFIESLCQTILPMEDLLAMLNNPGIDNVLKKPFLRCLHHVYLKSNGSVVDTQTSEIPHDNELWEYLASLSIEMNRLTDSVREDPEKIGIHLKTAPEKSGSAAAPDFESSAYGTVLYIIEGVFPFLETFYRDFYFPDPQAHGQEADETDHLAKACVMFSEIMGSLLFKPQHMKNMVNCLSVIVPVSNMPNSNLEHIMERFASGITVEDTSSAIRRGNIEYYSAEVELNAKFRVYAKNCAVVFAGHNTVTAQLRFKSKRAYTIIGSDEELPLGEEFQSMVRCFIDYHEKKVDKRFLPASKLLEQLAISLEYKRVTEAARLEMDELNIKCFQVLRALIHNEERKLPEDWATRTTEPKVMKGLKGIGEIQNLFDRSGSMKKSLPHLASRNDEIAKEVLAFLCIMLFNANSQVQQSMLTYFFSTREEVFFMAVRDRMALSTNSIKEKRSLQAQHEAKLKDSSKTKKSQSTFLVTLMALKQIQAYEDAMRQQRLSGWTRKQVESCVKAVPKKKKKQAKAAEQAKVKGIPPGVMDAGGGGVKGGGGKEDGAKKGKKQVKGSSKKQKEKEQQQQLNGITRKEVQFQNPVMVKEEMALMEGQEAQDVDISIKVEEPEQEPSMADSAAFEYRNDGYIELVLKVMARMCDGQNKLLQDYLREQPDNVKSFDIIAEVTRFLNVVYSNINGNNIDLVIQLFETMNEFTAGNQDNRIVIYDNKIIDYINFIMRAGDFASCSTEKILELRMSIANLVVSLIEENGPGATEVALEVKDTLDKKVVLALMAECYEMHQPDKQKIEELKASAEPQIPGMPTGGPGAGSTSAMAAAKSLALKGSFLTNVMLKKEKNEHADVYMDVGFSLFLILARMTDTDPKLLDYLRMTPLQAKAFNFYKKNCMSIEIVKDDVLQKVNFRVKNKRVLREEVKEKLKWSVDRSSPSNKIRDLMEWTKDIMKDIAYQQRILKNPIAILLTKGWLIWNHLVTILSFAINILMLVTWRAKGSLETPGIMNNQTAIPDIIMNPIPDIMNMPEEDYFVALQVMGGAHNVLCLLVVISYFVCNHPRLPDPRDLVTMCKKLSLRKHRDEDEDDNRKTKQHVSKLDARFFSVTTFFYMMFLALSIGGTFSNGYFFAFHLLNIVNNNQLLSGVIKAVTQNGKSLLWVAVLGLVVFYLYGIIGFAMMRSMFDPNSNLYCNTLWQCTVTVIRYGLIGDLFETMTPHENEKTFEKFGFVVLYHVSFFVFITTIGLNIIFGIIVDTFSELRDLKWTAESDMRDTCFICSRNSYDFEHHGKGFDHHVRSEHNMWSYIFFFIHLNGTKVNDYTALEMYVFKLLKKENYDFFPLDRALSLASMGKDSTETKLDDLLSQVTSIVEKQRMEELEKKRREERMRQKLWEQKHRLGSFRRRARLPGAVDTEAAQLEDERERERERDRNRLSQLSPLPSGLLESRRRPSITEFALREGSVRGAYGDTTRRPSLTDRAAGIGGAGGGGDVSGQRAMMGDIGARPSLSDLSGRLGHHSDHYSRRPSLTDRRSSGDFGGAGAGLSAYRQPSFSSRGGLERQRTLRNVSPSRYEAYGDRDRDRERQLRSHSPSRYDYDDPYVRNLSPVRYDGGVRSPSRSRQGSDPDLLGLHGRRGEVPTRDWSGGMLSPKWPDSRAPSPRGASTFFPETESLQSLREVGPDRLLGDPWADDHMEGPPFLMEHEIPTRERDTDADSHHSGDLSRYETRL